MSNSDFRMNDSTDTLDPSCVTETDECVSMDEDDDESSSSDALPPLSHLVLMLTRTKR